MERLTSKSNPKIKLAVALRTNAGERRERGLFFIEGARLCADAAECGIDIDLALITDTALTKYSDRLQVVINSAASAYIIDESVSGYLSDTSAPQGVFCICKILDKTEYCNKIDKNGKYIALDNIQNPDNLGAISRTAEALGLSGLIVSSGCDIYNPKAQRASMGALLRLPVITTERLPELLTEAINSGMFAAASVPDGSACHVSELSRPCGVICVVGNEGAGVRTEVMRACSANVTIPMRGRAESLNAAAAAAILMWEMVRQ